MIVYNFTFSNQVRQKDTNLEAKNTKHEQVWNVELWNVTIPEFRNKEDSYMPTQFLHPPLYC